jgi:hypothetical protein
MTVIPGNRQDTHAGAAEITVRAATLKCALGIGNGINMIVMHNNNFSMTNLKSKDF